MVILYDDIARAISQKNAGSAIRLLLEGNPPRPRLGRATETELWDFKADCPHLANNANSENAWAHIAADVVGFHNNRGGLLIFGIDDTRFEFVGATQRLDSKTFNDKIRRYIGDVIWVDYHREFIQSDQRYLGVALVPPRGPALARFKLPAPELKNKKRHFERDGSALRENDSTKILSKAEAETLARKNTGPTVGETYSVDEPFFRVLAPEYANFYPRPTLVSSIKKSLSDPRVSVTSLIGVGGLGKTALATWVANDAYDTRAFDFVVSTTAKDRELGTTGIFGVTSSMSSYEELLDQILEVLGMPDLKTDSISQREESVRSLIENSNGLLYVDNLETVDDKRVIEFLDELPLGVKALVTSRRNSIRTAARPIDVPPLSDAEVVSYIELISHEKAFRHAHALNPAEAIRLGKAWDGIPLAIQWSIARTKSNAELLAQAEVPIGRRLHGEQLLEFSFRRIFEQFTAAERAIMEVISILESPMPTEAIVAAVGGSDRQSLDALEELVDDAMVSRIFDPKRNDYCFTVMPITRAFLRNDLGSRPHVLKRMQRRLTDWYEAKEVTDGEERLVVRELRTGGSADDSALVDLALAADRRGDLENAGKLFKQALRRNPRSWRAAHAYAEFERHRNNNNLEALTLYSIAGANAPRQGNERAIIFREWGLLLRDSGQPDATAKAEETLKLALEASPSDAITRHALGTCYERRGAWRAVIEVLSPLRNSRNQKTRRQSLPILLRAYEHTHEILAAAELRRDLEET